MSKKTSLSDLAEGVLRQVAQADLEKTASVTYTEKKQMSSAEAQALIKVAAEIRTIASDNRITYADLAKYRKNHAR